MNKDRELSVSKHTESKKGASQTSGNRYRVTGQKKTEDEKRRESEREEGEGFIRTS